MPFGSYSIMKKAKDYTDGKIQFMPAISLALNPGSVPSLWPEKVLM